MVYGGARDAAIARKLPESAVPKLAPQAADVKRRTKRVITLPQEPAPGEPEILYDWMQTLGYHPTVYGISSTFPRRSFDPHRDRTLAQVGVTTDMVVMVDERDSEEEGD
uniref:UBX domain-containing protein n=1 Tax=Branchiostoma floridae TaxID=7739 RepID=C3Z5R8_BRAFL|eukprot:XP_002596169.1 hypothetical protein BRAFLDRAFT_66100 [Branchiostoma floridae]